jgi:hypothetical protein
LYIIKVRGTLPFLSDYIDQDFVIRINEPSYPSILPEPLPSNPSILPEPLPSYPSFLPEPLIVEIVEVIAGLKK